MGAQVAGGGVRTSRPIYIVAGEAFGLTPRFIAFGADRPAPVIQIIEPSVEPVLTPREARKPRRKAMIAWRRAFK